MLGIAIALAMPQAAAVHPKIKTQNLAMHTDFPCGHRSGKLCARYVRADLPLLDLASRAGLNSVLGIAIALAVLGAAALVAVAFIALRMRRRSRYKRAPASSPPACVTILPGICVC